MGDRKRKGIVIAFVIEKGGVAKSTLTKQCGIELGVTKEGSDDKVLLIDLDGQGAGLTTYLGIKDNQDRQVMYDVLRRNVPVQDVIVKVRERLDIIPSNADNRNLESVPLKTMKSTIRQLKEEYDYILIDVGPKADKGHVLSLCAADYLIIPATPTADMDKSLNDMVDTVEEVQDTINPMMHVLGIVIVKDETITNLGKSSKRVIEEYAKKLDTTVFKASLRNATAISETVNTFNGITEDKPRHPAADDVRAIVREIEEKIQEVRHG